MAAAKIYFNQLLNLLQREVDVFHTCDCPNYELMYDIVRYLREYGDEVHHPREDVAFERLAKRCPDIELALARLRQEHRVIAEAGDGAMVSRRKRKTCLRARRCS